MLLLGMPILWVSRLVILDSFDGVLLLRILVAHLHIPLSSTQHTHHYAVSIQHYPVQADSEERIYQSRYLIVLSFLGS